ncbi:actin-like protein arp8 [Entomophthora muscae]|uniref:Actin-like protein arp8 n=1 Tax=Entomophthora muscae TaxID=34485 RepID=A0ACC2RSA5_9FUNG|nr:actin-like protein arp8 [Entomophthora muscae]
MQHDLRAPIDAVQPRSYPRHNNHYPSQGHHLPEHDPYGHIHHEQNYRRIREDIPQDQYWTPSKSRGSNPKAVSHPDPHYMYQDHTGLDSHPGQALLESLPTRNVRFNDRSREHHTSSHHQLHSRYYEEYDQDMITTSSKKNFVDPNQKILKFTSFPIFFIPSCRNPFSGYSQVEAPRAQDALNTVKNAPFVEFEDSEQLELELSKNCIIMHPGSRNIRLGLAGDPFPKEIPHVIARRTQKETKSLPDPHLFPEDKLDRAIFWGEKQILQRLQDSRRKPSQNAQSQVLEFNSSVSPTPLPDHNDPYKRDAFNPSDGPEILIGDKVDNIPESSSGYIIRYPLLQGKLNTRDYSSLFEVRADLEDLWSSLIQEKVGVSLSAFEGYSIGLVIPDQYCPVYVSLAIDIFLNTLGFHSIFLIQESVSATFGAGISSACVVNVGAQNTSISCVEEGYCLPHSRITMPYGGDDVTALLVQLLHRSQFPYHALDIRQQPGWNLAEKLKWQLANMNENELSIHLSQFYVPIPGQPTLKFDIKVYDEGFIAPMLYFNPTIMDLQLDKKLSTLEATASWAAGHILQISHPSKSSQNGYLKKPHLNIPTHPSAMVDNGPRVHLFGAEEDDLEDDLELASFAMELEEDYGPHLLFHPAIALDSAIFKSIQAAAGEDIAARRWYSCILITGGGAALIPGFADMLTNTLRSSAPIGTNIEVLTSVRDLDPRDLSWKGASVFAKLDSAPETFINFKEWELRGLNAVKEKLPFAWPKS